jgi:hypothetical protein
MAVSQPPDVGEERVRDGETKHSLKSVLMNRRTWKVVIGIFSLGFKIYRIVAKATDYFG